VENRDLGGAGLENNSTRRKTIRSTRIRNKTVNTNNKEIPEGVTAVTHGSISRGELGVALVALADKGRVAAGLWTSKSSVQPTIRIKTKSTRSLTRKQTHPPENTQAPSIGAGNVVADAQSVAEVPSNKITSHQNIPLP